eukprot:403361215
MLQETTSQAQHAEFMIAKEREYEKVQQKLYDEFKKLDINNDGSITIEEVVEFLKQKGGNNVDTRIAEELFIEIDRDQSGRISLNEFVESYFLQQREVEERIEELTKIIQEDQKKRVEIQEKLKEISETEQINQYGIMIGSVLTATVIEARELRSSRITGTPNAYVMLTVEGQRSQTDQAQSSTDPVWNEIITFDITTGREPLVIQIYDRVGVGADPLIGECEISLDQLNDQYKHDEWFQLENGRNLTGKVRLNLHWIHSRKRFLQDILKIQDLALEEENAEREGLMYQLENMKKPFGFMTAYYEQEKILAVGVSSDPNERLKQFTQITRVEKTVESKFDEVSQTVASKLGMKEIPWFRWTMNLTVVYTILTILVCFHRQDFMNLTVCTVAIYMLLNLEKVTQYTFRYLVLGIFISILYDLFWFSIKSGEYEGDIKGDSGVERKVRLFSYYASLISFFVRLIMALIYWKDSLDFDNIMLGRKISQVEVQSGSPKERRQDNLYIRDLSPQGKQRGTTNMRF